MCFKKIGVEKFQKFLIISYNLIAFYWNNTCQNEQF
jgi:hypothetical protein